MKGHRNGTGPAARTGTALLCALVLAGCEAGQAAGHQYEFVAFATTVHIEIRGVERPTADAAVRDIEAFFHSVDRDWYAWGDGELSHVNRALLQGRSTVLSSTLRPLIARAMALHAQSGGLFEPAVATLVETWGFSDASGKEAIPTGDEVARSQQTLGKTTDLRLDGRTLHSVRPLALDLGGLAKGSALERIRRLLATHGIDRALVDIGGSSLLALGRHDARPWRVGVRDPRGDGLIVRLALHDGESLSTSGDYARFREVGARRYHHIVDPRTGFPSVGATGVTVIARDAELADAATTAMMVGGAQDFAVLARRMGVDDALLVTPDGRLLTTAGMAKRLGRAPAEVAGDGVAGGQDNKPLQPAL